MTTNTVDDARLPEHVETLRDLRTRLAAGDWVVAPSMVSTRVAAIDAAIVALTAAGAGGEEERKALLDAQDCGYGFMLDGRRVAPDRVTLYTKETATPTERTPQRGGHSAVLRELLVCCQSWEPQACVMGNVRAGDAAAALEAALASPGAADDAALEAQGYMLDHHGPAA